MEHAPCCICSRPFLAIATVVTNNLVSGSPRRYSGRTMTIVWFAATRLALSDPHLRRQPDELPDYREGTLGRVGDYTMAAVGKSLETHEMRRECCNEVLLA